MYGEGAFSVPFIHCMNSKWYIQVADGSSSFSINDVMMHGITAFIKDF